MLPVKEAWPFLEKLLEIKVSNRQCMPATTPTLGSATWFNYQRNLPTSCLQAKETLSEISGTDDIFGIQIEPGDTNFLLELRDLKNAEVTESSPVQAVLTLARIGDLRNCNYLQLRLKS